MDHKLLINQVKSIIEDETDLIANFANVSALINMSYENINWVGFYFYKENQLVLGPFQGKVACTRLYPNKGVCMKAIETKSTQNISDVHLFEGHVVCDSDSNSELVVPLFINNKPFAVLDIDSPIKGRFSKDDQKTFETIVDILIERVLEIERDINL